MTGDLTAATDDLLAVAEEALTWPAHRQHAAALILADTVRRLRAVQHLADPGHRPVSHADDADHVARRVAAMQKRSGA